MYPFRKELVGKRFLCVREKKFNNLRPNSRSSRVSNPLDYQWKVGVIRACTEKDFSLPELKVLVEYDNVDWTNREWLTVHDGSWKIFLVEESMVWAQRPDPENRHRALFWPALTFIALVDRHGLTEEERPVPVEFVGDHERAFLRSEDIRSYGQDDEGYQPTLRNNAVVLKELYNWQHLQKSQSILTDGPFTLTGFRVQVYRQNCRQWFSAVITAHDLVSRELSVMDDTVLQTHRVNPTLVQVVLLANEAELDSLLRGELVRVLPMRQHRQSQVIITAPLTSATTTTTTRSGRSSSPSSWQLFAGVTQATTANNLGKCTPAVYQPAAAASPTILSAACTKTKSPGLSVTKERRKSSEARNRSTPARRGLRSNSSNIQEVVPSESSQPVTQPPSSYTPSSTTPLSVGHRTVPQTPKQATPHEDHSVSAKHSPSSPVGSPLSSVYNQRSPIRQTTPTKTSPSMSPYKSSPLSNSPVGTPVRSNLFCTSPISGMQHMGMQSPGRAGCSRPQSPHPLSYPHLNISPNQLYALHLQQQQQQQQQQHMLSPEQREYLDKLRHQHFQSLLHQYQTYYYQLQLMVQQQEMIQQMPLTLEQQRVLAEYYNQLLHQYQVAQIFQQLASVTREENPSQFHPIDGHIQVLPERIQQQLREAQERQKQELHNLMPRLEPDQLQTLFTRLHQQSMTMEQMHELYTQLLQQQTRKNAAQAQQEEERQGQKLQHYLRQHQEQLQKFLQFPTPSASAQTQDHKPEANSPSTWRTRQSSSPSSYTFHHGAPSSSNTSPISTVTCKKEPSGTESDPSMGSSTPDIPRVVTDRDGDEVDKKSNTTGSRDSSPCPAVQKLLEHHLAAVEASKQGGTSKTRKSKTVSEPKRRRRRRRSSEVFTNLNRDFSDSEDNTKQVKPCLPVLDSSTEKPSRSVPPVDVASSSQESTSVSTKSPLSEVKMKTVINGGLPWISNGLSKECQGMTAEGGSKGQELASSRVLDDRTPSGLAVSYENVSLPIDKTAPSEKTRLSVDKEESKPSRVSMSAETATAPWVPEEATDDQRVSFEERMTVPFSDTLKIPDKGFAVLDSRITGKSKTGSSGKTRTAGVRGSEKEVSERTKTLDTKDTDGTGNTETKKEESPMVSVLGSTEEASNGMKLEGDAFKTLSLKSSKQPSVLEKDGLKISALREEVSISQSEMLVTTGLRGIEESSATRPPRRLVPRASALAGSETSAASKSSGNDIDKSTALRYLEKGIAGVASMTEVPKPSTLKSLEKAGDNVASDTDLPKSLALNKSATADSSTDSVNFRGAEETASTNALEKRLLKALGSKSSQKAVGRKTSRRDRPKSEKSAARRLSVKGGPKVRTLKGLENIVASRASEGQNLTPPASGYSDKLSKVGPEKALPNENNLDTLENIPLGASVGMTSEAMDKIDTARESVESTISFRNINNDGKDPVLFASKGLKTYSRKYTGMKRKSSLEERSRLNNYTTEKVSKVDDINSACAFSYFAVEAKNNHSVRATEEPYAELSTLKSWSGSSQENDVDSVPSTARSKDLGKNFAFRTKRRRLLTKKAKESEFNFEAFKSVVNEEKPSKISRRLDGVSPNIEVNSVSFVGDQSIADVSTRDSPTSTDSPSINFETFKPITKHNKRKKKIREVKEKKKERRVSEKSRSRKKNALFSLESSELLETVVDSVLDEDIPVIKLDGKEEITYQSTSQADQTLLESKKREPKPRGRKKKNERKQSESDGDAISGTEQHFLQDCVCASLPDLPKCRDCRDVENGATSLEFCRFNMFRRLRKKKNGKILTAGFQLPEHAEAEDFIPWVANEKGPSLDKKTSLYILNNVADQFCSVMIEEKKVLLGTGKAAVAYKRAVQGVREMCDVCATTIFNLHWVCHRCGFGVCLDCYNLRVKEREEQQIYSGRRVFEFKWIMCCPGICHQPKYLSVAQIIPKTVLSDLGDELHKARNIWKIGNRCPCKSDSGTEDGKVDAEEERETTARDFEREVQLPSKGDHEIKTQGVDTTTVDHEIKTQGVDTTTKTISSSSRNRNLNDMDTDGSTEESDDVNLMCDESMTALDSPADREHEWLTEEKRRNLYTKKAGCGLIEAPRNKVGEISSGLSLLMDYNSSEGSPCDSPAKSEVFNFSMSLDRGGLCGLDLLALACERTEEESPERQNGVGETEERKQERTIKRDTSGSQQEEKKIGTVPLPVATAGEATRAEDCNETRGVCSGKPPPAAESFSAPHSWLCNGRLLRLHEPRSPHNIKAFETRWRMGEPVLVSHVDKYLNLDIWTPRSFGLEFGSEISDVVNCRNGGVIEKFKVGDFWLGFESIKDRPLDQNGEPMLLKLKDWPPKDDFSEKLPTRFEDLMNNVPLPEYTRRDGSRNLVSRLPGFFVKPDLGPKMYNAYGSAACPKEGTTNLHLDMSDAVNVMVYVGVPRDQGAGEKERNDAIKAVDEACDESQRIRVRQETARIGALWHIYAAEDANKIRECLREVAKERKMKYPPHHDPIHDQCFYLDHDIRQRLLKDYGVEGWAICQCLGDAVFIPAGAPHQVRNLYSCVKVAEDFVSPERIDHCFRMTQEFRYLSDKHTNHEDKLQVKNIIYHAVKDAIHSLKSYEDDQDNDQTEKEISPQP